LWPFYDYTLTTLEFIEFPIHQSPISSLRVSYDYTYLISGSEGGSIFLSKIREYLEGHDVSSVDMISALGKGKNKDIMGKFANVYSLNLLCLTSNTSVEVI
jgi:WD40 repeat protein